MKKEGWVPPCFSQWTETATR